MHDYTVTWQSREQIPTIPVGLLFAGRPVGKEEGGRTPVIGWGQIRACIFDDQVDRQLAWLIVYGDGRHVSGGEPLRGFRHVDDVAIASDGSLILCDVRGRKVSISRKKLDELSGRPEQGFEGLPLGIPFYLSNGREKLIADEEGVRTTENPDAGDGRWLFIGGQLVHSATRRLLGVGPRLLAESVQAGRWSLSSEGALRYGDGAQVLVADPDNGQVHLQAGMAAPGTRWAVSWIPQVARSRAENLLLRKLEIVLQVAGAPQTWVEGSLHVSINGNRLRTLLAERIDCGALLRVAVDLQGTFPRQSIFLDDLHSIQLFHGNTQDTGHAWRMSSLELVANDAFRNRVLGAESPWLLPEEEACWESKVSWLSWRASRADMPLDYAGYTCPANWPSMVKGWLSWREPERPDHDLENFAGTCQLMGVANGRILAYDLVRGTPLHLPANAGNDVYTWAYSHHGSFIIKHWHEAVVRDPFFRHRRLEAGEPVVCAGELRFRRVASEVLVDDVLCMTNVEDGNDYWPDAGACLVHVLERLAQLGFEDGRTLVYSREPVPESPGAR